MFLNENKNLIQTHGMDLKSAVKERKNRIPYFKFCDVNTLPFVKVRVRSDIIHKQIDIKNQKNQK